MIESTSSRTNPQHYSVAREPVPSEGPEPTGDAHDAHDANDDLTLDAHVRSILDTPEGVSATRRPRAMEEFSVAREVVDAWVKERVEHPVIELGSHALAGGLDMASPALLLFEILGAGAAHDIERGERQNQIYHHDRYRGFIAGFEGRSASPEARREAALHPGYRDGLAAFERFLAHAPPAEVEHILAHVDASRSAGMDAVLLGRDHGAAFERRYETDLVFHHAVDFERREHIRNPEAFATKKAAAEAREVERSRHSLPVRP